jgi:hypothetical protein
MPKSLSLSGWIGGIVLLSVLAGSGQPGAQNKLEPSGPPGPTMKRLDDIPPTWSQILPAEVRFELVLGGVGVLDKETGLVWERSPSTSIINWIEAQDHCNHRPRGNRYGWRLPTIQELASLMDPTTVNGLPSGHPFTVTGFLGVWSATTNVENSDTAWVAVYLVQGATNPMGRGALKLFDNQAWCVRGGQGVDLQ